MENNEMNLILCDTKILIEVYRDNHAVTNTVKQIGQANIAVSDVTCAELMYGARNKTELKIFRKDLDTLTVLPVMPEISKMAVMLVEQYCLSHKLALPDALIAATSIYHQLDLYTLNIKDFIFIPEVKLFQL
ncbi:MAG: type II toxin-antitoxin system VapC family toxin [Tannerella sp.]|jgi:predicted nucleic acid-binding protein|nr:type II toxin-antitoxin system VapC family toxin [Tannerella sp.]